MCHFLCGTSFALAYFPLSRPYFLLQELLWSCQNTSFGHELSRGDFTVWIIELMPSDSSCWDRHTHRLHSFVSLMFEISLMFFLSLYFPELTVFWIFICFKLIFMKEKKLFVILVFFKKIIKMQWFLEWLMSPFIAEVPHMCSRRLFSQRSLFQDLTYPIFLSF